jgi:outer membrane lipoprotein-sorting protein
MRPTDKIKQYLKNLPIKTNPRVDQAVLDDLLDRLDAAQEAKQTALRPNTWRILMHNKMTKLSAAAVILIAAAVLLSQFIFPAVTFADVVKPLLEAKTLIYDFVLGSEDTGPTLHDIVSGNRIRRTISNMQNVTMILDTDRARMLHLEIDKKEATFFDMNGPLQTGTHDFLKFIRHTIRKVQENPDSVPEKLGTRKIDGRTAVGFSAGRGNEGITIWADQKTALPLRIEFNMGDQKWILKNFEFDVPVDDSLVSMDVPDGYTLKTTEMDLSDATEQDFIAGLKVWSELFLDGRFPERLTAEEYMKQVPLLEGAVKARNLSESQAEQMGVQFIKGMMFNNLFEAKGHQDKHYAGAGVKLGDASKAIFWYRPKDSQTYRVIYGDLSVKDVAPENLPK